MTQEEREITEWRNMAIEVGRALGVENAEQFWHVYHARTMILRQVEWIKEERREARKRARMALSHEGHYPPYSAHGNGAGLYIVSDAEGDSLLWSEKEEACKIVATLLNV